MNSRAISARRHFPHRAFLSLLLVTTNSAHVRADTERQNEFSPSFCSPYRCSTVEQDAQWSNPCRSTSMRPWLSPFVSEGKVSLFYGMSRRSFLRVFAPLPLPPALLHPPAAASQVRLVEASAKPCWAGPRRLCSRRRSAAPVFTSCSFSRMNSMRSFLLINPTNLAYWQTTMW